MAPPRTRKQHYLVVRSELAKSVKIIAAKRGTTMQQIVAEAMEEYLNAQRKRETGADTDNVHFVNPSLRSSSP